MVLLAPKADITAKQQVRKQIIVKIQKKADIFGLIETGINRKKDLYSNKD